MFALQIFLLGPLTIIGSHAFYFAKFRRGHEITTIASKCENLKRNFLSKDNKTNNSKSHAMRNNFTSNHFLTQIRRTQETPKPQKPQPPTEKTAPPSSFPLPRQHCTPFCC